MAKVRTHKVVVTVTFNRPLTRADAVREAKNSIHGDFYPDFDGGRRGYPTKAKIGAIRSHKET